MAKLLMAQVKDEKGSAQPIIVAFGGRQYSRVDWRQVPAGSEAEAKQHPNLNTKAHIPEPEPVAESGDLSELSVKALKAIAKEMGLTGYSKLKQPALLTAIEDALLTAPEEPEETEPQDEPDEPDEAEGD